MTLDKIIELGPDGKKIRGSPTFLYELRGIIVSKGTKICMQQGSRWKEQRIYEKDSLYEDDTLEDTRRILDRVDKDGNFEITHSADSRYKTVGKVVSINYGNGNSHTDEIRLRVSFSAFNKLGRPMKIKQTRTYELVKNKSR